MTTTEILTDKLDALHDLMRGLDDDNYPTEIDRVQLLRMIRDTAESTLRQAVPAAAASGSTWEQIGRALDVTRQAAWERYGALTH